jgi:hypothetical protein
MPLRYNTARATAAFAVLFSLAGSALARPPLLADERSVGSVEEPLAGFDAFVNQALHAWEVPGLAIAVVKNGQVVLARGYGLRDVDKKLPVTPNTLFAIGSCTKAFTTFVMGTLIDEGKLDWDKPVRSAKVSSTSPITISKPRSSTGTSKCLMPSRTPRTRPSRTKRCSFSRTSRDTSMVSRCLLNPA